MVSLTRDGAHRVFRKDPALVTRALRRVLDIPLPEARELVLLEPNLGEGWAGETYADMLLRLETDEGAYLLLFDSLDERDEDKRGGWASCLLRLYAKYRCAPVLIVLTPSASIARWAAHPISQGPSGWDSLTVRPLVIGPDDVPFISDKGDAERDVFLAALSTIVHGRGPEAAAVLKPLAAALAATDPDSAGMLAQFVESCLADGEAKRIWEELMMPVSYRPRHEAAEKVRD
jgi:hypothetical protein